MSPLLPLPPPDISSVATQIVTQAPITSWVKLKSALRRRNVGPKPHSPGFERPHE